MLRPVVASFALLVGLWQTPSATLPDIYKSVYAVTWVVRDLDKTVAAYQRLGFTDVAVAHNVRFNVQYRGQPAMCVARVAEGHLGDVAVQWIQPLQGANAYSEFLSTHGTGMFSLVHRTSSPEALQAEIARMNALGIATLQSERVTESTGTSVRTYLDTQAKGKYALGLIYTPSPDPPVTAPPGRKVVQFAFTVRQLAPVLDFWSGLGFTERSVTHPPLWDLRYHEQPGTFDAELGWQRHGRVVYEWVAPLKGPTVYSDHMEQHGEGFHHIAFEVSDLDAEVARWNALGFHFIQGGAWGEKGKPGWGRFAYQDTDAIAGSEVELLWNYR